MANDTEGEKGRDAVKESGQVHQVERAFVGPDGTITIPQCAAKLASVDVADVDLLLSFSDNTFVVIPNGALDAIGDTPPKISFADTCDNSGAGAGNNLGD